MSLLMRMAATPWAMQEPMLDLMTDIVLRHDLGVRLTSEQISAALGRPASAGPIKTGYEVRDGVAIVPISGVIARFASEVNGACAPQGTSTEAILQDLRSALADGNVTGILLHINSPGGAVSGVKEAADIIAQAAKSKPMVAFVDGLGASAAYWLAAGAGKIYSTETSFVGSIGVYTVLVDSSKQAETEGRKIKKVASGPYKGAGVPGTAITAEQEQATQIVVDQLAGMFFAAVGAARKLTGDALAAVTDGRAHLAKDAMRLGLTDGIRSFDQVLGELAGANKPTPRMPRASTQTTESSMRLTAAFAMALAATFPEQLAFISEQTTKAAADESITDASLKTAVLEREVGALKGKLATATTAHATAIAAKDTEIATLKGKVAEAEAKRDTLAGIKSGAEKDPGVDPAAGAVKPQTDAQLRADFAASADLQDKFFGGVESYVAFMKSPEGKKIAAAAK